MPAPHRTASLQQLVASAATPQISATSSPPPALASALSQICAASSQICAASSPAPRRRSAPPRRLRLISDLCRLVASALSQIPARPASRPALASATAPPSTRPPRRGGAPPRLGSCLRSTTRRRSALASRDPAGRLHFQFQSSRLPIGPANRTSRAAAVALGGTDEDEREVGDGGGGAGDRCEAGGAPGEGDQCAAAGLVRGAGGAVVGAAARDRRPGGPEVIPPRRQRLHVLHHVGLEGGALLPRRCALPAHLRRPPPRHLRRGGSRPARAQAARIRC